MVRLRRAAAGLAALGVILAAYGVRADAASASSPTVRLSGTVTDQSNAPVAGVRVSVTDSFTHILAGAATTDPSGNYAVSISAGTYNVVMTPPPASGLDIFATIRLPVLSDMVLNAVLRPLPTLVRFSGVLRDPNLAPIPNQSLVLFPAPPPAGLPAPPADFTTTGLDGSFLLSVPPAQYTLDLSSAPLGGPPGLPSLSGALVPDIYDISVALDLTTGRTQNLVLPSAALTISVVDGAGNPVPGASIAASESGPVTLFPGGVGSGTASANPRTTDSAGVAGFILLQASPQNGGIALTVTPPAGSGLLPTSLSGVGLPGNAVFRVQLHALPVDRDESNNDFGTATPIALPFTGDACIDPLSDIDFFTFHVPEPSTLSASAKPLTNGPFVLDLYDSQRNRITGPGIPLEQPLAIGDYFIRISAPAVGCYTLTVSTSPPRVLVPGHPFDFVGTPTFGGLVAADPNTGVLYGLLGNIIDDPHWRLSRLSGGQVQLVSELLAPQVPFSLAGINKTLNSFSGLQFAGGFGGADLLAVDTLGQTVALSAAGGPQRLFAATHGGLFGGLALAGDHLFVSSGFTGTPAIYSVDAAGSVSTFLTPSTFPGSLALSPDGRTLYYSTFFGDELVGVDSRSGAQVVRMSLGSPLGMSSIAVDPVSGDVYATVLDFAAVLQNGASFGTSQLVRYQPATGQVQPFADNVPLAFGLTFGACVEGQSSGKWCLFASTGLGVMRIKGYRAPVSLAYSGETSGEFHDGVTLAADLKVSHTSVPVPNAAVSFMLGSQSCSGSTDASGHVSCELALAQDPGRYTVSASYAGDSARGPAVSADQAFTITPEEAAAIYDGPTVIPQGQPVSLQGQLLEDGDALTPIVGRTLTLSLGSESCAGTTDANGIAACSLAPAVHLGLEPLAATFAGDRFYRASSDASQTATVFAFPSQGAFVLGDNTVALAAPTTTVTWWNHSWTELNDISGGLVTPSFKGFIDLPGSSPPSCGGTWTTTPANSSGPPGDVPSYMGTIVASSINKSGNAISGNVVHILVVRTDAGYAPDPGSPGTGTIVATYC